MKVKLIAKMNKKYNKNFYCLGRIDRKFFKILDIYQCIAMFQRHQPYENQMPLPYLYAMLCPSQRCGINNDE